MTMCGRFTLRANLFKLSEVFAFRATPEIEDFPPFDVTPTQESPVVRMSPCGERSLSLLRWGLVPHWSQNGNGGARKATAHAELVTNPPYFTLFCRARCLIPADGFYEWRVVTQEPTQRHFISLRTGEPFAFAGLWSAWKVDETVLESFTILTTEANSLIQPVHDRMPVIVPHDRYIAWLSPDSKPEDLLPLLRPYPAEEMQCVPVCGTTTDSSNETLACISHEA